MVLGQTWLPCMHCIVHWQGFLNKDEVGTVNLLMVPSVTLCGGGHDLL